MKKLGKLVLLLIGIFILVGIFHKPILKQVYKLEYKDIIDQNAEKYNVDKYLMYALIKKESRYDPLAVSKKGAMGLTQIMPETGKYIAELLEDKDFKTNDLYDAEVSIRYGTFYLSKLKKDFNGNLESMLAAYNGGEGNVRKWLGDGSHLNENEIPFKQTKNYVKSIKRDSEIYKYLYN